MVQIRLDTKHGFNYDVFDLGPQVRAQVHIIVLFKDLLINELQRQCASVITWL